jgi:hypothetical protein
MGVWRLERGSGGRKYGVFEGLWEGLKVETLDRPAPAGMSATERSRVPQKRPGCKLRRSRRWSRPSIALPSKLWRKGASPPGQASGTDILPRMAAQHPTPLPPPFFGSVHSRGVTARNRVSVHSKGT